MTGLELAAELKRQRAGARRDPHTFRARRVPAPALSTLGCSGYLLKDAPAARAGERHPAHTGGSRVIDPELAAEAWTEADPLTDRERQVLLLRRRRGERRGDRRASHALGEARCVTISRRRSARWARRNRTEAARIARQRMAVRVGWPSKLGRRINNPPQVKQPAPQAKLLEAF